MRSVKHTSKFKRDLKREYKTYGQKQINVELNIVINLLRLDIPLPAKFKDHSLKGSYLGSRGCHLRNDLILIYSKESTDILWLERLGSHSEIL